MKKSRPRFRNRNIVEPAVFLSLLGATGLGAVFAVQDDLGIPLDTALHLIGVWMTTGTLVSLLFLRCLSRRIRLEVNTRLAQLNSKVERAASIMGHQIVENRCIEVKRQMFRLHLASIDRDVSDRIRTRTSELLLEFERFRAQCESDAVREIVNTSYALVLDFDDADSSTDKP